MDVDTLRILDANLNRARESLRVIEDHARFALDDQTAAEHAKIARHSLRAIVDQLGHENLLTARDIIGDVGRDTKTGAELRRDSDQDVVRAAFARVSEAARAIGEYAKVLCSGAAETAERLRYSAYELEQEIALRGTLRARFRAARLYVIITEALCAGDWLETAAAALLGGADCLQIREKTLSDRELRARAQALRALTAQHEALLIVNDRPAIARLAGADGVHVGQDDLTVREVRRIAGANLLVGKSTHTLDQFDAALAEQPDYIAVGPMYQTPTKPQSHIAGPETLADVAARTRLPVAAIGGVNAESAAGLIARGATCVCACSAVIAAADPAAAARAIVAQVNSTKQKQNVR